MDRVFAHSYESGAAGVSNSSETLSRHVVQVKEMKLDVNDSTNSADALPHKERRGFRPQPKLCSSTTNMWSSSRAAEAAPEEDMTRVSEKETKTRFLGGDEGFAGGDSPVHRAKFKGGASWSRYRSSSKVAKKISVTKGLSVGSGPSLGDSSHARTSGGNKEKLLIEGSSVLNGDTGLASQVLAQLSDCVNNERRIRKEMEAVRKAKTKAFQALVRVYFESLRLQADRRPRALPDSLAVARCSVITNTLVATIQANLRAVQSCQVAMQLLRDKHDLCLPAPLTARAPSTSPRFADSRGSVSSSRLFEDVLGVDDINELKQLYFDYFDCEVISITTPTFSCTLDPEDDGGSPDVGGRSSDAGADGANRASGPNDNCNSVSSATTLRSFDLEENTLYHP